MRRHPLIGEYPVDPRFGHSTKALILLLSLFNSQFLFVKGANPFGIHFVQEFYLLFLVAYATFYLLRKRLAISRIDAFVLLYVGLIVGLSTFNSGIEYGQPIFYGVFEARVTFMILAFFPFKDLVKGRPARLVFVLNSTVVILFVVAVLGLFLKIGLVSIQDYYSLGTSDITARGDLESAEILRADRLATGRFVIIFAIIYALTTMTQSASVTWTSVVLVAVWDLVFVLQERQSMVGVGLALLYLMLRGLPVMKMRTGQLALIASGIIAAVFIYWQSGLFSTQMELLNKTLQADFTAFARFETALTMFENMHLFLGHGALSLLWQDGFHRVFSTRFFLGDVGVFGTAFRLGLIPALILLGYAVLFFRRLTLKKQEPGLRRLVTALVIYLAVTAPTLAPFEYSGNYLALILLILAQPSKQSRPVLRTPTTKVRIRPKHVLANR